MHVFSFDERVLCGMIKFVVCSRMVHFRGNPMIQKIFRSIRMMILVPGMCIGLFTNAIPATAAPDALSEFRAQIEADWLRQEKYRPNQLVHDRAPEMTTRIDAAGGSDGIKDGKWGFHTGRAKRPWWHVDLGASKSITKIVVWNRTDGIPERAANLTIQLSNNANDWRTVYSHNGVTFYGFSDNKPLVVHLDKQKGRFVRIQLPGVSYLHLDEVEVFGPENPETNLALDRPADQISTSQWSTNKRRGNLHGRMRLGKSRVMEILTHCNRLALELREHGMDVSSEMANIATLKRDYKNLPDEAIGKSHYLKARWIQRRLTLAHPILNFDSLLFTKRVPTGYNHMSDQYIGWWSRPGGGLYILKSITSEVPTTHCISQAFTTPGSFLRPMLSYDGRKVLFAWCKHYKNLAAEPNKLNKDNVPEDAFYHLFEMNIDGTGLRQLTYGKYDDFDGRYLPDGRIVFLSTRRGQFIQCGLQSARRTLMTRDLPDVYVRCGGGPERPCVVYTLHTLDPNTGDLCAISPFEMFEWTPSIAHDGSILYSRWDYIDRDNMPYMSLWATNPDGTSARIVYANYTRTPHCTFEPRCVPDSQKIVFTASAHHSQTMGSLVLLDPKVGTEGPSPITRLTPEVPFPEAEGWPETYYANPWPLSERFYLVTWGDEGAMAPGKSNGWDRWHTTMRPANGMGLYLFDAEGNMELLYRDPDISCMYPMPLRSRKQPPRFASKVNWDGPQEGRFIVTDVYRGLKIAKRGDVKALRIIAVPAKTHPTMNYPNLGVTRDDPGKCVLGTVPVEKDGSAYFRVPSGVIVFFQALDANGMAIQTMRSTTHVQPGQTLSCIGCHESRNEAPPTKRALAVMRPPSKITPGPNGSWPLRFDRLVQPVLDRHCVQCHNPDGRDAKARQFDLTASKAYESMVGYGQPSLHDHILTRYRQGKSVEGACPARQSELLAKITDPNGHHNVTLDDDSLNRLIVWMDGYAQRLGSFSIDQEQQLVNMLQDYSYLLVDKKPIP